MAAEASPSGLGETERLRLENETLSAVVGVVTSGPDLGHILDRMVDLLTKATDCHACFVYLRAGERLVLRAASPVYSHLAGRIGFGVDEGLAGWTMERGEAAFIREGAIDDPRTTYVPELEEERFQSMVAVPIPARAGQSIGAIVLHTVAPREFDERILNVLSRAASLVAGAIENARLYEEAQERVEALTLLSALGREIAALTDRRSLFELAAAGLRDLLGAAACHVYEADSAGGLHPVAGAPAEPGGAERAIVLEMLESEGRADQAMLARLAEVLGFETGLAAADAVSLLAGGRRIGALLVVFSAPWPSLAPELLRAAAQQIALAAEKIELIERLTEENLARDLFRALVDGDLDLAAEKAAAARLDLGRPHVVLEARPADGTPSEGWSTRAAATERSLKAILPEAFCDVMPASLRAIAPVAGLGVEPARRLVEALSDSAPAELAIGVSEARGGLEGIVQGLREAGDAAQVASVLAERNVLLYRDTGAYRYLLDVIDSGGPQDHLRAAVEAIAAYDRDRRSQLMQTLDEYLSQGRSVAATSRALYIHVNTLRQRLERIEQLTGLSLADEDLLALQLAVKLGRLR